MSEKMIEDTNNVENIWLLQCLTEKDLGNYTCVAITTKYDVKWSDSRVTLLTGEFNGKHFTCVSISKICQKAVGVRKPP